MDNSSSLSDVFPSFCGIDVRKTILSHLLDEFTRKGISTFIDSNIKRSKSISPVLVQAIRRSRICIIIISKNYASSIWCLDELVEIVECNKTCGKMVMIIFYDVDPSDVSNQSGAFGDAYRIACENQTEQKKQKWEKCLTYVSHIAGEHSKNWCNDAAMISKIAMDVSNELNITPSRDFNNLVGIEAHVAKMNSLLCQESNETRMVGIWGPAGIGKTTIARVIYNHISRNYQLSHFMENVKTSYKSGGTDSYCLKIKLQEKFLSEILNHKDMKINHLGIAKEMLKFRKVLIVLDDVDKLEQLHALANQTHWFGKGSRIIVITEDKNLLKAHGINHIYEVKFPSREEALKIFSQSAFTQNVPLKGYEELALEVTELTSYLPLGLCVLGKALRGKCMSKWIDELPRIKTSLNKEIEKVLRDGYNVLDDKDKSIFLHIACLFEGKGVEYVIRFLENCGLDIKYGLNVLVERALISILSDKIVIMHRLLRQMGREIVCRHSSLLSWRCKFLLGACEIYDVIADNTGTKPVLGTLLDTLEVSLTNERGLSGSVMQDHKYLSLSRNLVDKVSKLVKLCVIYMIWLLKYGFDYITSMYLPTFSIIPFGISRKV